MKETPTWLKIVKWISLSVIALFLILLVILWVPCFISSIGCDGLGEAIVTIGLILPVIGVFLGLWLLCMLINFLNNRNLKIISNIIAGIIALASIITINIVLGEDNWITTALIVMLALPSLGIILSAILFYVINKK